SPVWLTATAWSRFCPGLSPGRRCSAPAIGGSRASSPWPRSCGCAWAGRWTPGRRSTRMPAGSTAAGTIWKPWPARGTWACSPSTPRAARSWPNAPKAANRSSSIDFSPTTWRRTDPARTNPGDPPMLRRPILPRLLPPLLFSVLGVLATAPARASFSVSPHATRGDFEAFHRRFSSDAYFYPRHSAAPLGLIGFEVYADATYEDKFDDQSFNQTAVDGDYTGGFLSIARVGARKGLPGGVDLGLAYGKTLNGDVKLISAELQYAILHGG